MLLGVKQQQQTINVPTRTIVHPCYDVILLKCVQDITIGVWNINQSFQALQRHLICLTDSEHGYILDKIYVDT